MRMMSAQNVRRRGGFSLVELLAVVLVLAVLAAVAVPLYTSQRRSAAGRACRANETAIVAAASAWALRNGTYPTTLDQLVGAPEGLTEVPRCPLGGTYSWSVATSGTATLACPNATSHVGYGGTVSTDWVRTLAAPGADTLP